MDRNQSNFFSLYFWFSLTVYHGKTYKKKTQKDNTVTEQIVPHTAMQLRKELLKLGIRVPRSLGVATLKSLYLANGDGKNSGKRTATTQSDVPAVEKTSGEQTSPHDGAEVLDGPLAGDRARLDEATISAGQRRSRTETLPMHSNSPGAVPASPNVLGMPAHLGPMQTSSWAQTNGGEANAPMGAYASTAGLGRQPTATVTSGGGYTLASAFNSMETYNSGLSSAVAPTTKPSPVPGTFTTFTGNTGFGVPSDALPHVETVSPALKQAIIQGKDVNLSLLWWHPMTWASYVN